MSKRQFIHGVRAAFPALDTNRRGWLLRIALSLAVALLAGALAYLVARAIGGAALFAQQQELLRAAAGALQGGIEGLGASNLREVRLRLQQIDARNERLSLLVGFAVAGIAVVVSYVWMERRTEDRR